ncbi:MAG: ArgE/DapE family deacylase [Oligoflexia bacterium]|nr:ArgE/DapE family deacylase [Oligoflexia bacterium]
MMPKEMLGNYFKSHEKELVDYVLKILAEVVKEKTVNVEKERLHEFPYLKIAGQESLVSKIVMRELKAMNVDCQEKTLVEGRSNVLGFYGKGDSSLLVAAHMDVVPPGDGWSRDPFTTHVDKEKGLVYGRGVIDNKGPLVATLCALKVLNELKIKLNGTFIMGAIASEEYREQGEEDPGLDFLIKSKSLNPKWAIIPDVGGNMQMIDVAEKGRLQIKITSTGKQAHGSTPQKGINAVTMMSRLLLELENMQMQYVPHNFLDRPTLNIGTIRGGSASNIVPAKCEAVLDIRYLPSQSAEGILKEIKGVADRLSVSGNYDFEVVAVSLPHEVDSANILVKTIQENAQSILGTTPRPFGLGGGTFAKSFNLSGIVAVGYGPGDDTAFHIADEYIEIKQLLSFAHMITAVAMDLLGYQK